MFRFQRLLKVSAKLVEDSRAYEQSPASPDQTILFLGDSTAVGTGVKDPRNSVAGRFGQLYPNTQIINRGVNGKKIHQLVSELDVEKEVKPDLLIIQIGGNDILRFTPIGSVKKDLEELLKKAFVLSKKVVILHSGRVGDAPFFPKTVGWLWTLKASQIRKLYIKEAKRTGVIYVDLFGVDKEMTYAPDGVHPNDEGYGIWFEKIQKALRS